MDIERLKTFLSVAQYGSFQQAAQRAFLSQRAVSKQIATIEQELGVPLFYRGHNRITLTPQGRRFLSSAQDIVNNYANTLADVQNIGHDHAQTLRVGYFSFFEQHLLQDALYSLLQTNPDIQLTIKEGSNEHLTQMVTDGDLDLALSINYGQSLIPSTKDLTVQPIFSDTMVMGVSTLNELSHGTSLDTKDLSNLPILYYSSESSTFLLESFLASAPFIKDFEQIRRVPSVEQMNMLVSLNKAIAFYPQGLLPPTFDQEHIKLLPLTDDTNQAYTIEAMTNSQNNSPIIKQLITTLLKVHSKS